MLLCKTSKILKNIWQNTCFCLSMYVIIIKTSGVPLGRGLYEHLVENLKKGDKSWQILLIN